MGKDLAKNKKALFDFSIIETFEAGIVLKGSEVKALRAGRANLKDSFARVIKGELFLLNAHISHLNTTHSAFRPDERAPRKLLMHRKQIDKIFAFRGTGKQMWNSAITEPGAGSDVGSLKTTYTKKDGKVYLNGQKCFITSSAHTPYIVVMARDSQSEKPIFTEWFVDMSKPGIKLTPLDKLGLRMDSCCEIVFDNVELEEKDVFGEYGNGFNRVKEEFDAERFLVACTNYGIAYCAFEDAAKYANQRVQFGETIGRTQLIQEKFAHMAMRLNAMKYMVYSTAWKMDQGLNVTGESAMCKFYCANNAFAVVDDAIQVLGGIGVTGHRVSRFWRDLRVDRLSGGSDEMQILTLGRAILKQYR